MKYVNKLISIQHLFFISIWKAQNKQSNAVYPVYKVIAYIQKVFCFLFFHSDVSTEVTSFMIPKISMIEASSIVAETNRILSGLFQEKDKCCMFKSPWKCPRG